MGTVKGLPDLILIYAGGCGFIELKAGSALRAEQRAMGRWLQMMGHGWACCRSVDEVDAVVRQWKVPLAPEREKLSAEEIGF